MSILFFSLVDQNRSASTNPDSLFSFPNRSPLSQRVGEPSPAEVSRGKCIHQGARETPPLTATADVYCVCVCVCHWWLSGLQSGLLIKRLGVLAPVLA